MVNASSAGVRALAITTSVIVHALAFAAGGHSTTTSTGSKDDLVVVTTDVETTGETPPLSPLSAGSPPTHTHTYPVAPSHDAHPHDPSIVHALAPAPLDRGVVVRAEAPAAAEVVTASAPAHFSIALGGAARRGTSAKGSDRNDADGPMSEAAISTPARLLASVVPAYPPEARANEVEADVALEVVLDASGAVTSARIARRAGYGFDDAALSAIRRYRFFPALKDGRPVGVRMRWSVSFRLQ